MKVSTGMYVSLIVVLAAGTGCNTMRGAGKDIQKGGEAIEDAAENVQEDINAPAVHQNMVMASAETGGSISPSGTTGIDAGKSRTFTINADVGFQLVDVLVDGKSLGTVKSHTFHKPTGDHTISALFTESPAR